MPSKRPRAASSVTAKTKAGYSFCSMRKHSFIVAKRNPSLFLFNASSDLAPHRIKASNQCFDREYPLSLLAVGISDVKKSSSSPRALLTQANYLARAELAEGSFTVEDRESEATFPSTLGTELPLREPFIRIAVTPG